jgi:adenine-specific DNA methylase
MLMWTSHERQRLLSDESRPRFEAARQNAKLFDEPIRLRGALLDFIADFSNWDNATVSEFVTSAERLTMHAHQALGGEPGTRPLVVDPFAGGGSIPLEALRVGADAYATDLNPVAVLLNKVLLEYIPKYRHGLAAQVREWGTWIEQEAARQLGDVYPPNGGGVPVAYFWARTIRCEGPGCGAEVPIITKTLLAQRKSTNIVLDLSADTSERAVSVTVKEQPKSHPVLSGTVRRSSVSCPVCRYTTPASKVRDQFLRRRGGTADARMLGVATAGRDGIGRSYRSVQAGDLAAIERVKERLALLSADAAIPTEQLPYLRSIFNINLLGVTEWGQLFAPRQALHLATFVAAIEKRLAIATEDDVRVATATCMALILDKMLDFHTSLTTWIHVGEKVGHTFGRQALGIVWDYTEANPLADISGSWQRCVDYFVEVIEHESGLTHPGHVFQASATQQRLPDSSAAGFITDPPYYDLVPYADLSDFFYVWLKRTVGHLHRPLFDAVLTPKREEIVQLAERNTDYAYKTRENFEALMSLAMKESRRVLTLGGIGVVFFAHKGTGAWEAQLQAMIEAGWVIVCSWPLATERQGRLRSMNSAVLASSIQLVCRPRNTQIGLAHGNEVGDWRDVLQELPKRIHEWMPRLVDEGVVGADAIFACLGPALEVFSRFARVEKASGEVVKLKEYLEHVWAAVAREALSTILQDGDAGSIEPDARLTVIWLWTLGAGAASQDTEAEADDVDESEDAAGAKAASGYFLEFDAARKIAQGLGANLETLEQVVAVKGDKARLLPVSERAHHLFGKSEGVSTKGRAPRKKQMALFEEIDEVAADQGWGEVGAPAAGITALDRVHQAMILFGAGRSEGLKRFLVEEGVGRQASFWKLSQALAALYPMGSDERRWVEGVLTRKKGLGFG